nr:acetyl ornithine aminotransferase family protein [Deltaproteobacteria bacterium]
ALIDACEDVVSSSYTRDYPLVAERGEGSWIIDPDGNEFLDVTAGIAVCATGHSHPEIVGAIAEQAAKLIHMSGTDFYYAPQTQLAAALSHRVPVKGGPARAHFSNSGAEANEAAMKLARWSTRRPNFISFANSFHGRTYGTMSLTASKVRQREGFGPFLPGVHHTIYPDAYRMGGPERATRICLDHLEEMFLTVVPAKEVAAIFVEPIQGEGGYVIPPDAFLIALRALCDEHGILLVFDEVQSGMGRTGKLWACEHSGVKPDILTSAKGIASGMPLGATFASRELMSWPPGAHASTFGGNPISCAAALKTLEILDRELIANAQTVGAVLVDALQRAVGNHPRVGDIRGRGLMIGVELVKDRETRERDPELRNRVVTACFEHGLLILGCGRNTIRFASALSISPDEARLAAELFADALAASVR